MRMRSTYGYRFSGPETRRICRKWNRCLRVMKVPTHVVTYSGSRLDVGLDLEGMRSQPFRGPQRDLEKHSGSNLHVYYNLYATTHFRVQRQSPEDSTKLVNTSQRDCLLALCFKLNATVVVTFHRLPSLCAQLTTACSYEMRGVSMPICTAFSTPKGCSYGNNCKFGHLAPDQLAKLPSSSTARLVFSKRLSSS
jgi:hypothetical protein